MDITVSTKLTAVFGNPIGQSLSPLLHNEIYRREGVDAVMLAFQSADIKKIISAMRALPIHLSAVTLPHKQAVIPLLDEIDPVAEKIGSVNTVVNTDGRLKGFNTDVVGIAAALKDVELAGKNVLTLGAGGVAQSICHHLQSRKANIYCYDGTFEKADAITKKFGGTALKDVAAPKISFDVIINATPVGMVAGPCEGLSPIAPALIRRDAVVFDLIYKPRETKLIQDAKARGARTISGIQMFLSQGVEQERLWLGREINVADYAKLLE